MTSVMIPVTDEQLLDVGFVNCPLCGTLFQRMWLHQCPRGVQVEYIPQRNSYVASTAPTRRKPRPAPRSMR